MIRTVLSSCLLLGSLSAADLATGDRHSFALRGHQIYAWGENQSGQLGLGHLDVVSQPTAVPLNNVVSIASGADHGLALDSNLAVWSWGKNSFGQLGLGSLVSTSSPMSMDIDMEVVSVAAGAYNSYLLDVEGNLYSFGRNHLGQCGQGSVGAYVLPPTLVDLATPVIHVQAGADFAMALDASGEVWAWGSNGYDQLGLGVDSPYMTSPSKVNLPESIQQLSTGGFHTLALAHSGNVYGWGKNVFKQVNSSESSTTPQPVLITSGVSSISAGREHSVILNTSMEAWLGGRNNQGQLGQGTISSFAGLTPLAESSWLSAVSSGYHNLALMADGSLQAWGLNDAGQVGGDALNVSVPAEIDMTGAPHHVVINSDGISAQAGEAVALSASAPNGTTVEGQWTLVRAPIGSPSVSTANQQGTYSSSLTGTHVLRLDLTVDGESIQRYVTIRIEPSRFGTMTWGSSPWSAEPQQTVLLE